MSVKWRLRASVGVRGDARRAGDVALDAAPDFAVGLSFGAPFAAIVACGLVVVGSGDRDDVEGVVELSVAAAVEAVPVLALA